MPGPALRAEWDKIVIEACFTPTPPATQERGQDWAALMDCKRLHPLTVCDEDVAERQCLYMAVNVKRASHLKIKPFYKRIKEMDQKTPSLPCLKDRDDCPAEAERANVQTPPFGMCSLIMRNASIHMKD